MGPGVAGECHERHGLHVNEDHFIVEVIDPEDRSNPLRAGREGELVFTTITKEGFPLIRYRTGDITSLNPAAVRLRQDLRPHGPGRPAGPTT